MIYDSKEQLMQTEGRLTVSEEDESRLIKYEVDGDGLEDGKRYLMLPEGLKSIAPETFSEYNEGQIVLNLQNKLVKPEQAREDWQKKLRGQRVIKITFPDDVESWFDKAEFMRKKELRVRFLRLYIPESVESLEASALPALLERIQVSESNPNFASAEGVLYSKDMKTLIRYPGYRDEERDFELPESAERVKRGAFKDAVLGSVRLHGGAKLEEGAFENAIIDELVLGEGIESIDAGVFLACDIRRLVLPESLGRIEAYAFKECAGISEIEARCAEPEMGEGVFSYGYFRDTLWWPWENVPKAAFLNAHVKKIALPEGVKSIEDFAFAGCYRAKAVELPASVTAVGPKSFDLGESFSAPISVPDGLLKYCYRFPALSRINGKRKHEAWNSRLAEDVDFAELPEVLESQREAFLHYAEKLGALQAMQRVRAKQEAEFIDGLLKKQLPGGSKELQGGGD